MASVANPPHDLFDLVKHAVDHHKVDRKVDGKEHPSTPPLAQPLAEDPGPSNPDHEQHPHADRPWKDDGQDGGQRLEGNGGINEPNGDHPGTKPKDAAKAQPEKLRLNNQQQTPTQQDRSSEASPKSPKSFHASRSIDDHSYPHRNVPMSSYRSPPPGTPQQRTGPPRSISYNYSVSSAQGHGFSPPQSRQNSSHIDSHIDEDPDRVFDFPPVSSPFRGALEYEDPEQRKRERSIAEHKHKRRESYFYDAPWNPKKWLTDSPRETPREELPQFDFSPDERTEGPHEAAEDSQQLEAVPSEPTSAQSPGTPRLRQSRSMPHIPPETRSPTTPKWGRLKSLLPHIAAKAHHPPPSAVAPANVNITDELITGGLATLIPRLWFERDDRGHRRVPALFHRLRIRVSDSLHPLHGNKAVFRIECEYAGAVRWVVYRQLREFLSLHTHYTLSNAYSRNIETLPEFPLTSLPYFKFLKERGNEVGRADFARLQRETIENYLIGLIRAVMFNPSVNRLSSFLEFGALTIALAQSGGSQYKAGFMRLEAVNPKASFGRKAAGWREKKKPRWCAVRESYLVAMEEMGELTVWDVFMIDQDFAIERPTRYYRQGLHLLHLDVHDDDQKDEAEVMANGHLKAKVEHNSHPRRRVGSTVGSIKSSISKFLHVGTHKSHAHPSGRHSTSANNLAVDGHPRPSHDVESSSDSSSSISGPSTRPMTPMLDPSTNTNPLGDHDAEHDANEHRGAAQHQNRSTKDVSKHVFYVVNSQTRLKLYAKNERQMMQWIAAFEKVARESHYTGKNRFDSFAPIRLNVAAQWLVDGRDYFWNLSRAILLARETIQIHDWWLSPELQMRRPNKDKYRLDHLLEKKAKEGVKIYIILYQEVSSRTTPVDSNYAKQRLTGLHPNIMVQRSPSHFQTGTFYWAHHEKLCVIDQAIAFMGGLDHCFGRWDTPQHVLIDDPEGGSEGVDPIWPGKDYSNPRVQDFHTLNKPHEDMYDRAKVPRMPWHDVSMQVVGQPARDIARHFVQRWNHLLRIKNHSRTMPFLLPPPEFKPGELADMGLTGTCELQICRSAGPWSMGTPERIEHSIQNAYLKAIQMSEHFVYIENQFFITSTVVNEVKIENRIGDAIVHRIIRAHRERTPWKCCIVIPLLPGFSFPVDHSDASAIRIIIECQNRTICRGPNSIYARLRKEGIDPDDHITVFSLRNWGKLRGDVLTTEQVYIHGKVCIVDDRLAIIGSANINERSQRGDRDSEIAAVIRDTDMLDCTMAGKPFKVGRFAHTLRVRLMREHLGVDVDSLYEEDLMAADPVKEPHEQEHWDPEGEQQYGKESGVTHISKHQQRTAAGSLMHDIADGVHQAIDGYGAMGAKDVTRLMHKAGVKSIGTFGQTGDNYLDEERKMYTRNGEKAPGLPSSLVPTLEEKTVAENRPKNPATETSLKGSQEEENKPVSNGDVQHQDGDTMKGENVSATQNGSADTNEPPQARLETGELFGAPADASTDPQHDDQPPHARSGKNDADEEEEKAPGARVTLRKHLAAKLGNKQWQLPTPTPQVDPYGFEDPISDTFWKDVWVASAVHNTEIFRKVFHAIPDDLVTTWKQYKEFVVHHERLNKPMKDHDPSDPPLARMPSEAADAEAPGQARVADHHANASQDALAREKEGIDNDDTRNSHTPLPPDSPTPVKEKGKQSAAKGPQPFDQAEKEEMECLLRELRGHLVLYPTRFLEGEDVANNFLFPSDRLLPLPIYN